jgi:hypothetical protein
MEKFIYIDFSLPPQLCDEIEKIEYNDYLNSELNEHIQKYKNIIKNRNCYKYENMPNLQHKNTYFKINEEIHKELIQYFWALEDGAIIIQKKTYYVKKGDIIIFPNSWVFPYELNFAYIN